jgi:hypothetical protein
VPEPHGASAWGGGGCDFIAIARGASDLDYWDGEP